MRRIYMPPPDQQCVKAVPLGRDRALGQCRRRAVRDGLCLQHLRQRITIDAASQEPTRSPDGSGA